MIGGGAPRTRLKESDAKFTGAIHAYVNEMREEYRNLTWLNFDREPYGEPRMTTVYVLWHTYEKSSGEDEEKLRGIYSTEGNARNIIERVKAKPGFRDHPNGFQVVPVTLDASEWLEGFGI